VWCEKQIFLQPGRKGPLCGLRYRGSRDNKTKKKLQNGPQNMCRRKTLGGLRLCPDAPSSATAREADNAPLLCSAFPFIQRLLSDDL
jgi:hypothetical protein